MKNTKEIFALYDNKTIRIYQAYNDKIADEAVNSNKFGKNFSLKRMTWIKPSFLWMMHRSNWGIKKDQSRILAIDILREGFDYYLNQAVLTSDESKMFNSYDKWETSFKTSDVYCQWDPDRNIYGNPIDRKAIQIGIRGQAANDYVNKWIVKITDITPSVIKWRQQINNGKFKKDILPKERIYPVSAFVRNRLNMD